MFSFNFIKITHTSDIYLMYTGNYYINFCKRVFLPGLSLD